MSRESVAQRELDKAEARFRNSNSYNEWLEKMAIKGVPIAGSFKSLQEYSQLPQNVRENFNLAYFQNKYGDRIKVPHDIAGKFGTAIEAAIGLSKGKDLDSVAIGIVVSEAVGKIGFMLCKTTPAGIIASVAISIIDESFGITDKIKKAYDDLMNNSNDLPEITANGYLKLIMPDGTVYARPFETYQGGHIIGGTKDDVLFGGDKDDKLVGGSGSDILIGGAGKDDYFVDSGDIIKDSDGNGRVFLENHQLTGGTQIEKGSQIYKGKDGTTYELKGSDLIINDNITIENFSNDKLEIHLSEFGEIHISISDASAVEKDQSMKFIVSLNKEPEVGEFVKVSVGKKTYKFMNFSETNYTIDEGVENVFGAQAEYEYVWNDDTVKEEDEKFKVTANIVGKSDGLKASVIKNGNGTIIDDDRDDDPEDVDPIIIDLNKNKITSTKLNNTIYFDHDNNNFKEATSWIDKGDAFLALDKNSNRLIDNGNELFGNHTISNTRFKYTNNKATNGYEALKAYDLNGDIDSKDEIYDKLVLWKDSNQNAITDKGSTTIANDVWFK